MNENAHEISTKIKKLNYMLESCTYTEDKEDIIGEIYKYTDTYIDVVASFCLDTLFREFTEIEEPETLYKIFDRIFSSKEKDVYLELLLNDILNVKILFQFSYIETVYFIENIFRSEKIGEIIMRHNTKDIYMDFCIKAVLQGDLSNYKYVTTLVRNIAKEIIYKLKDENRLIEISNDNTIKTLLVDDECKLIIIDEIGTKIDNLDIANECLILNDINYKKHQEIFYTEKLIRKCITENKYEFMYKLVLGNTKGLKLLLETIDISKLIIAAENNYYAANILSLAIDVNNKIIIDVKEGNIVKILAYIKNIDVDIKNVNGELSYIAYCLITGETPITFEFNKDETICRLMTKFIEIIHGIENSYTASMAISLVDDIIRFIVNNNLFSTKIDQMIIMYLYEYKAYFINIMEEEGIKDYNEIKVEFNREEMANKQNVSVEQEDDDNFISLDNFERLNKGIQNVFNFFKSKD